MQQSLADLGFARVDPGRLDAYQDLARPGAGLGTSTTWRTSTPPYSSNRTAFGMATPFSRALV